MANVSATPRLMLSLNNRGSETTEVRQLIPASNLFIGATTGNAKTQGYPT
jgi:hypothetical protein